MEKGRIKVDGSEVQLRKTKKRGGGVFACEQMGGQYTCMIDSHYIFCNATPFSMCAWVGKSKQQLQTGLSVYLAGEPESSVCVCVCTCESAHVKFTLSPATGWTCK